MIRQIAGIFVSALCCITELTAQTPPAGTDFFEAKIRPVLAARCYGCHSAEAKVGSGGLRLDSKNSILDGGQSGPALVPGKPDESLILKAVRQTGRIKMPPGGKLPEAVTQDFEKWIAMGAPDPREMKQVTIRSSIDIEKGREFWAFQQPKATAPPKVRDAKWARTDIDKFLLAKMEEKKLAPVPDADRRTLIRRVYLDITGLPPRPKDVEAFVNDKSKNAYAKVVDSLLESPQFGERWGRHWLDVARYGESMGRTRNLPFPFAWRYRDYVIAAFNKDKPYDQFLKEQVAGDLMESKEETIKQERAIATGFLALGSHDLNEQDALMFQMDVADEMVNVTSRAMLGITVGCARCHDHKFDPIPTTDYYAIAGIFRSTAIMSGLQRRPRDRSSYYQADLLLKLTSSKADDLSPEQAKKYQELLDEREGLTRQVQRAMNMNLKLQNNDTATHLQQLRQQIQKNAEAIAAMPAPKDLAMGVSDAKTIADCKVNIAGDAHRLGQAVPRGVLQVATYGAPPQIGDKHSGRLELANWIASKNNPLTARVMVNRVWHQLYGRGIVRTVDNFGKMGDQPTNQQLLDTLAVRFMENGWSVKKLVREVVASHAYQLSSDHSAKNFDVDPDNVTQWRMNRRRLEAESIRDSILMIAGKLKLETPDASPVMQLPRATILNQNNQARFARGNRPADDFNYRAVYMPLMRGFVPPMFQVFDFPEPSETHGARDVTTVAPQALFFMNSPFVLKSSEAAADRLIAASIDPSERVTMIYHEVLSRKPNADETRKALDYVKDGSTSKPDKPERDSWARLYQALFGSAEFLNRT